MDFFVWSDQVVDRLVNWGFEFYLVEKVFKEAGSEIELEYKAGELTSAGACFLNALKNYDNDLALVKEREAGRRSHEIGKLHGISVEEARAGWRRGVEKKLAVLSMFRGDEVAESRKKRKVLYYLPLVRPEEVI